jgi:hypothetical protein
MRATIKHKNNFEVKRASSYVFIRAILCLIWGILLSISAIENTPVFYLTLIFFVCLGIVIVIKKDIDDSVFIEIDKDGVWVNNQLITDWRNYIESFINKEYSENGSTEKLIINVKYLKDGENGYFLNQIFFNGNEDKSEQEVIEAAKYFCDSYRLQLNNNLKEYNKLYNL